MILRENFVWAAFLAVENELPVFREKLSDFVGNAFVNQLSQSPMRILMGLGTVFYFHDFPIILS